MLSQTQRKFLGTRDQFYSVEKCDEAHATNEKCEQPSISKHHNTHPEGTLYDMTESYHLKAMIPWTGDSAWCYCFWDGVCVREFLVLGLEECAITTV